MENTKKVPTLRFPEFSGEWGIQDFKNAKLSVIDGDRGINYPNGDDFSENGYCLFLNAKNVTKSGFSFDVTSFITKEKDEKLNKGKLKRFDLIITTRGSVGNIAFYDEKVNFDNIRINSGMVIIRNGNNNNLCSRFIYTFLASTKFNSEILKISFGSAQPQLTVKEINKFKIQFPSIQEQQKIADFIFQIDNRIEKLTNIKQLLERYKKGVMQKIFSQELRFKDDEVNDYPDLESKELGDIARITTGSSNRIDSNLDGAYTFFDRSQDIRSSNQFLFDAEAVIVPGEGKEFIPKYFIGKFDLHQRTYAVMDFENQNGKFLFFSIYHNSNHLNSHAVGSTVKSLRLPMFQKMPIQIPCFEEQTKIANFLTEIDNKINHVSKQLEGTKKYKKGLLQQMFI